MRSKMRAGLVAGGVGALSLVLVAGCNRKSVEDYLAAGDSAETVEAARLLRLAQSGDAAAFEALMRIYEVRVARTALRLLGARQDAQDAAQEVFLRLYRNLRRIDTAGNLAGWLYRVTVNACHDVLRKRRRSDPLDDSRMAA